MLKRQWLAASACLTVLLTAACARLDSDAGEARSTLATVGETPVRTDDVMALLSPVGEIPVRLAAGTDSLAGGADPLDQALRDAINDELLAQEADRQGIEGVNRAQKISRLLEQQARSWGQEFDEAQVRAWYADHRYLFDHVGAADVSYVVLDSSAHLDEVVAGLQDPHEDPAALGETYSAVSGGRMAHSEDSAEEVPLMIERIVNAAKRQGAIGYDRDPATGHWWVVEIRDVTLEPSPWHPELATKVEEAMKWSAEQELISSLASSLEARSPVVMHEENIEQFDLSLRGD